MAAKVSATVLEDWEGGRGEGWEVPRDVVDSQGKLVGAVAGRFPHNWGRWGAADELGTINFITADRRRAAARLVTEGLAVGCSIPVGEVMPVHPSRPAVVHTHLLTGSDLLAGHVPDRMAGGFFGADDHISMPLQSATHWDGLSHAFHERTLYNGFWVGTVGAAGGARRCSLHLLAGLVCGRGVLLDVTRDQGFERLPQGFAISAAMLERCAERQGIEICRGDILLIRTGEMPWFYSLEDKSEYWTGAHPGLSAADEVVEWIHGKEVAAIAMDNRTFEVTPFEVPGTVTYPLHSRLIRDLGLTIGELWWLEDLAETCAALGRYEFMLSAPPIAVQGASGAPTAPVASF